MVYAKNILSALAAIIIAELVPTSRSMFIGINNSKATGSAAVLGGLVESVISPLFWMLAIVLFAIFFIAGRAGHRAVRIIFFWIPTLTACCLAAAFGALITFLVINFRNS